MATSSTPPSTNGTGQKWRQRSRVQTCRLSERPRVERDERDGLHQANADDGEHDEAEHVRQAVVHGVQCTVGSVRRPFDLQRPTRGARWHGISRPSPSSRRSWRGCVSSSATRSSRWRRLAERLAHARRAARCSRQITDPLKDEVRRQGLWAAHLPPDMGGLGFGQVKLGLMHEILGQCAVRARASSATTRPTAATPN